jgi:N-acetylmuramoyl-L-alanine amidase
MAKSFQSRIVRMTLTALIILAASMPFVRATPPVSAAQLGGQGKTVYIDPGHGGLESGAAHTGPDGKADVVERDVNLNIALKLRALLEADGFRVAMSRSTSAAPNTPPIDRNGDGRVNARDDYQAVVDLANDAKADLMVSIHNNGSTNKELSGTEVWYSPLRAFADRNLLIARLLQQNIVASLRSIGYNVVDRGIKDDSAYRIYNGRPYEIFVLGEADNTRFHPQAAQMPAALGESLFLSNDADAAMLGQDRTQEAIARGYHNAIVAYFERLAQGTPLEWPVPAVPASAFGLPAVGPLVSTPPPATADAASPVPPSFAETAAPAVPSYRPRRME